MGNLIEKQKIFLGKKIFHILLKRICIGELKLTYRTTNKTYIFGDKGSKIKANLIIKNDILPWKIITLAELGLGMGYVNDDWESESPYHVILILLLNEDKFRHIVLKGYRFEIDAFKMASSAKKQVKNTAIIEECRKQIGLTYDIGNDFYYFMLGKNMMYSCAIWPNENATLDEAQAYKAKVIIDKLRITANDYILDIGCGWGTLCDTIQRQTKAKVRGIALSHNQINECKAKFANCEFEYKDYREERGQYDKIVSVGMLEHVGRDNLAVFMQVICDLLKENGLCLLHLILPYETIFMNHKRDKYLGWGDILMPGASSPTQAELVKATMNTACLRILHTETFAIHYARTGLCWLANLQKNKAEILKKYSLSVYKSHEYAWILGRAAMETGYCLLQMVLEKKPYGSSYTDSVIDVIRSRANSL